MKRSIVSTISQKCKRCYSCVKGCPAKAIRVLNGQAVVIEDRCISCGHCVKVCSQNAKRIFNEINHVIDLLSNNNVYALIAPSFAASYPEDYNKIPTALKKIGFKKVIETAFGADLVGREYAALFEARGTRTIITSACPAINNLIEKYHEELIPNLAQIVSPMIAAAKYIKKFDSPDIKTVFIGPCAAKKSEYIDDEIAGVIDAALTFTELNEIIYQKGIILSSLEDSELDPPYANIGKIFPLAGGLLKTADAPSDILARDVIIVEGKDKAIKIIEEIKEGKIKNKFIDILFCEGCINGPAIESELDYFSRREALIKYFNEKITLVDKNVWKSNLYNSRLLNLSRKFRSKNQRRATPSEEAIAQILERTNKKTRQDELNCGACGYDTCREYAIAIGKGLAEEDMCLPYLIDKLELAYEELKTTQEQLHSAEKLASIGQLAAGVAHEINNPLGTILLYSSMLKKEIEEKIKNHQYVEDLDLMIEETNRCKNIVSNLLNFARQGKLKAEQVDLYELINKTAKIIQLNPDFHEIKFEIVKPEGDLLLNGDYDQLKQVFLNLFANASEAMEESKIKKIEITLKDLGDSYSVEIKDYGCGIPKENIGKLFTPFFTTKKMGKGTGLGLAITYGIIKMHRGDIRVISEPGGGAIFSIKLPKSLNIEQISIGT